MKLTALLLEEQKLMFNQWKLLIINWNLLLHQWNRRNSCLINWIYWSIRVTYWLICITHWSIRRTWMILHWKLLINNWYLVFHQWSRRNWCLIKKFLKIDWQSIIFHCLKVRVEQLVKEIILPESYHLFFSG